MTEPFIEPTPISKMDQVTVPPSGTSLVPAIIWNPDKLGPGVGGWESKAVPVSALSNALVNKLITGHGAPTSLIGSDGDVYIDLDTFEFYEPKTGGVWPTPPTPMLASVQLAAVREAGYAAMAQASAKRAQGVLQNAAAGETKIAGFMSRAHKAALRAAASADQVFPQASRILAATQQILRRAKSDAAYAGTSAVTGIMPVLFSLHQSAKRAAWQARSAVDTQLAQTMVRVYALSMSVKKDASQAKQAAAMTQPLMMEAAAFMASAARSLRQAKAIANNLSDDQIALKARLFN